MKEHDYGMIGRTVFFGGLSLSTLAGIWCAGALGAAVLAMIGIGVEAVVLGVWWLLAKTERDLEKAVDLTAHINNDMSAARRALFTEPDLRYPVNSGLKRMRRTR